MRTIFTSSPFAFPYFESLLEPSNIFLYPQKRRVIISSESLFLLSESLDSSNNHSSKVSDTFFISHFISDISESL